MRWALASELGLLKEAEKSDNSLRWPTAIPVESSEDESESMEEESSSEDDMVEMEKTVSLTVNDLTCCLEKGENNNWFDGSF